MPKFSPPALLSPKPSSLWQSFVLSIQWFTRLPLNFSVPATPENMAYSLLFLPLIGGIVGILSCGIFLMLDALTQATSLLVSALLVSFNTWITGGIHLDGLGDTADAWLGAPHNREKMLRIMKDPNAGIAAILALCLVLILQVTAIDSLLNDNSSTLMIALLICPILSRSMGLMFFITTRYGVEGHQGLCSSYAQFIPKTIALIILIMIFSAILIISWVDERFFILLVMSMLSFLVIRYWALKHLGGFTGDIVGSVVVISEVSGLVSLCLFHSA